MHGSVTIFHHSGVVVFALPGEDVPIIEARGGSLQVPFTNEGIIIACLLE